MPAAVLSEPSVKTKERVEILDLLRGGAMILVMAYHLLYDLKFIYGVDIPKVITPGSAGTEFVHTCFLWVLFAVSGICTGYSRNSLKRGVMLYMIGWGITLVTTIVMPSQLIVFGVLSCFGACMAVTSLIKPLLDKIPWQALLTASFLLWIIFSDFHRSGSLNLIFTEIILPLPNNADYLYPIGIKGADFTSADYFPVIPYIFMFITGYALHKPVSSGKMPGWFYRMKSGPLGFIGRHSLIIYAVHQPIIMALLEIIL